MPLLYLNLNQCQADKRVRECLIDLRIKANYAIQTSDQLFPIYTKCRSRIKLVDLKRLELLTSTVRL